MNRHPQIGARVHWNTGVGVGQTGKIIALQGTVEQYGTMAVEWDCGQCSKSLPQKLLTSDPRWSYAAAAAE